MIAFLFPGQGVQQKNMLDLIKDRSPFVEEVFEAASDATKKDIRALCSSDDLVALTKTENAQPVLTAVSCALDRSLKEKGIRPGIVAGHSLGQYSALMSAESLSLWDGFSLIAKRAELMGRVQKEGALCAVVGLDEETLLAVCEEAKCEIALKNAPGQIVIGGEKEAVIKGKALAEKAGAIMTEILPVSNAFHTSVMKEIEEEFSAHVRKTPLKEPTATVLLNCKGGPAGSVEDIRADLINQTCHTVLWADCMKYLVSQKPDCAYEVGMGKVLASLLKRQDRKIAIKSVFEEV